MNISKKHLLSLSIALALAGCGGGGGSSSPAPSGGSNDTPNTDNGSQAGSQTTVSSTGVITGFGSVYVNGVRFDTAGAEVEFEDRSSATEDDLRLGMKVEIEGSREGDERRAERIFFDRDLKGPVSQVNPNPDTPALGSLVVLGQTVLVDANTVFDDDTPDLNQDGTIDIRDLEATSGRVVIEVSGFHSEEGLVATRIERLNQNDSNDDEDNEAEIKGTITDLDSAAGTFRIRDLAINYEANDLNSDDFPEGTLSEGIFVEVEGQLLEDGSLDAEKIEREDDRFEDDDNEREGELEIEGILQSVDTASTPNSITINGIVIPVRDASALVGLEGVKVEIEGTFDADGLLVFDSERENGGIKREQENDLRIEDRVETVGATSFTTRLGLEVVPTGLSRVEDDSDDEENDDGDRLRPEEFLGRLQMGDFIEARGFVGEDGSVTWTRVKREDSDDDEDENDEQSCELRGPVDADSIDATNGTFSIQGITIDTSRIVDNDDFEGEDDSPLGRDGFFSQLSAGMVVKSQSVETGDGCIPGLMLVRELEFELEDDLITGPSFDDEDEEGSEAGDDLDTESPDDSPEAGEDNPSPGDDNSGTSSL